MSIAVLSGAARVRRGAQSKDGFLKQQLFPGGLPFDFSLDLHTASAQDSATFIIRLPLH